MHAVADIEVPNRICPQKALQALWTAHLGQIQLTFSVFFPTLPSFTKVKNGQKQWACWEWMAVPIFLVPAIRKLRLPPSTVYCKLVYRFFPSFPSQNASLAWLPSDFVLAVQSVLQMSKALSLSLPEFVLWNNRSRSITLKHSLGCAQVRHKAIRGTYCGSLPWMLFKCMLGF